MNVYLLLFTFLKNFASYDIAYVFPLPKNLVVTPKINKRLFKTQLQSVYW